MSQSIAVLTGDLIGSTEAAPARTDQTMARLQQAATAIGPETRFTRYRGDGWQMCLKRPGLYLWAAMYLQAVLREEPQIYLPSRIAIGLGPFDHLGTKDLSDARGEAFVHSGRALDEMKHPAHLLALAGPGSDDVQRSLLAFVEDRIAGWSREQAEVMLLDLEPGDQATQFQIAARLGISRQAVAARRAAAGHDLLRKAHLAIEAHHG